MRHALNIGHIPACGWGFHKSVLRPKGVGRIVLDILQHYSITDPVIPLQEHPWEEFVAISPVASGLDLLLHSLLAPLAYEIER